MSSRVRRSSKGSSDWEVMVVGVWSDLRTVLFGGGCWVGLLVLGIVSGFVAILRSSLVLEVTVLKIVALEEVFVAPGNILFTVCVLRQLFQFAL